MGLYSALILAGGAGRRLGGRDKPALSVGGTPMLDRVLAAVAGAAERVVVGPDNLVVPDGVRRVSEQPPGGGPVAAIAAGLPLVTTDQVALLAADLPFLTPDAVAGLRTALAAQAAVDGVVFVDGDGQRQTLCGVWRAGALRERLRRLEPDGPFAGRSLRDLLAGLRVGEAVHRAGGPPPWYDCDTQAELDQAERWVR
jgi:molybdopterin-guanine dinucleotide biosynthesis protein A